MPVIFTYLFLFLLSYAGVEAFRRWSLRRKLLDIPNERSSHTTPTPRGGGLIIVVLSLTIYLIYSFFIREKISWSYTSGAILIAVVSWLDDLISISVVWRFLIHAFSAFLVITELGYFNDFEAPFSKNVKLEVLGVVITFLWMVWLTNAYNFMDGIDGIAGMQAVAAGFGWLMLGRTQDFHHTAFYGGVLAFASLGFLMHNRQPAKIFMGDIGSAFLGFSFSVLPLMALNESKIEKSLIPYAAVFLVWFFLFDTIYTFLRRLKKGEKVWQAHRTHIYQRLVIAGFSHRAVARIYFLLSLSAIGVLIFSFGRQISILIAISVITGLTLGLLFLVNSAGKNAERETSDESTLNRKK